MPDGRIKWVHERCKTEYTSDGTALCSTGTVQDITQKHLQDQQLHLLKSAVTAVDETIIITNIDGIIEYVNPSFERNTGHTEAYALGKTPAILNSKKQSKQFYHHFWKTIKNKQAWSGHILDRKKDGTIFPVRLSVAPITNDAGELTHFVAIHENLTHEEALKNKLMEAQKMEAVGVMAGGIAHDFNNLLASMMGNIYLMRRHHQDNQEIETRCKDMESSMQHGAKMIKQMLTFARKDHVDMHPLDLRSFIKESYKLAQASVPGNIVFSLNYNQDNTWVKGDSTQLQQLLLNLVTNAKHAVNDTEYPKISLELSERKPSEELLNQHPEMLHNQGWCCIQCKDNGYGISEGNLKHIFDPFFTTKEVGQGTGLGLAMTYGAVQSHRGIIDVQSTVGEGSIFSIYLPLHHSGESTATTQYDLNINGQDQGILIADDDENLRNVLSSVLRHHGFTVWSAGDGELALSEYRKYKDQLSLILLDVVMPNMGGIATAQAIRNIDQDIPIIFFTGYGEETQMQAIQSIQHSQVLSKPLSMPDLVKKLCETLDI